MSNYVITTDSTSDLSIEYVENNNIDLLAINFTVDGKEYSYKDNYDLREYYLKMRQGMKTSTMQANILDIEELFSKYAKEGKNILHIAFSSSLSGTYQTEYLIAKQVMEDYPDIKIVVLDSLAASGGQGLIVRKAVDKRDEGYSFEELIKYVEDIIPKVAHYFTVEDMMYLYRGGRISKGKALIANAINIKPILHCDIEGKLTLISKSRGRKKSIKDMVDMMESNLSEDYLQKNPYIIICHADCLEDAKFLSEEIKAKYKLNNIIITEVGPTIGAHSGPGTVAVFFEGLNR